VKLAGGSLDQKLPIDGRDIWPVLTQGAKSPHETLLLCGTVPESVALRAGDWKLLLNAKEKDAEEAPADESGGKKVELYNLVTDIGEQKNLADEQPEKVKELLAQIDAVMKTAVAPGQGTTSQRKKQK
jgi:arylsulfatase A-like enzyme